MGHGIHRQMQEHAHMQNGIVIVTSSCKLELLYDYTSRTRPILSMGKMCMHSVPVGGVVNKKWPHIVSS